MTDSSTTRATARGVALVTGAGRGIGRDVALALAAEGWSVGLLGRSRGPLDAVLGEVARAGGRAVAVPADVTRRDQVRAAVDTVSRDLGPPDLVVSNAGLREQVTGAPWEIDPDEWWRVVETNLRGPFLLAHEVLPAMVARGSGRLLHIGSGMGQRPQPGGRWSAYSVSKAALGRFTDTVAAGLGGTGVTVLETSPGLVRTDMTETMWGPADQQPWNPVERVTGLVLRFARGDLDALHGRFVHAGRDDVDALLAQAGAIAAADARTQRLRPYGPDDPLA
jgi:NAD(P)-dependent dehydrogenase (short-subunit alcohol dehydrogenase family)